MSVQAPAAPADEAERWERARRAAAGILTEEDLALARRRRVLSGCSWIGAAIVVMVVLALGIDPAAERFGWSYVMPALGRLLPGVSTPARSGAALARLLSEPDLAPGTGLHLDFRLRRTPTSAFSRREDAQDDLHRASLALCGLPAR